MKLTFWPLEENRDAETYDVDIDQLWRLVREKCEDAGAAVGDTQLLELSANEDDLEQPYLVLSWVAMEATQ